MFIKHSNSQGFTLIELLVVIAIIGVLSSVVLASLNSAREKGKVAAIKSTLKNLGSQAELNYLDNGSYSGSNPSYSDLSCTGTPNSLSKIVQPLIDQGMYVKCFSFNGDSFGGVYVGDTYKRFGATAIIYDTTELKAWSVDEKGVVKWDTADLTAANPPGGIVKNWADANAACANNGGRLPSLEELRTLSFTWYSASLASGTGTYTPTGFSMAGSEFYWSSTLVPSSPELLSYIQRMITNGNLSTYNQSGLFNTHCVR